MPGFVQARPCRSETPEEPLIDLPSLLSGTGPHILFQAWIPLQIEGFDLSWRDVLPQGLLEAAACEKDPAALFCRVLRLPGSSPDAMLVASGLGDVPILEVLIRSRGDVACRARRAAPQWCVAAGQQPIHIAAQRGRAGAAALLIQHRAKIDATCRHGHTPLAYAVISDGCSLVRMLLTLRSDVHQQNSAALGLLEIACLYGRECSVAALLEAGARPTTTVNGWSALHQAVASSSPGLAA